MTGQSEKRAAEKHGGKPPTLSIVPQSRVSSPLRRPLHNLPIQLTSLIGRDRAFVQVKELLPTTRLLTLTGAGGVGKTRLALEVAARVLDQFIDGSWVVDLAPLADAGFLPQTVAATLNVAEQPGYPLVDTLTDYLRHTSLLLVLDNCEHLQLACAQLASTLLRMCPHLRILATSRVPLNVPGESLWRVPSLTLPASLKTASIDDVQRSEAVRLFVERARSHDSGFALTPDNAPLVARICQQLDGIPLAIELAASRVRVLTVQQIDARLDNRFRLLTGGGASALPRHQTLRATLDWSYGLLLEPERILLRRLAVFAAGCTLDAVEAVCAGEALEGPGILDLVTQLVDKSLVVAETEDGVARYQLQETVRQYSLEKLVESNETAVVRTRHRDWYLQLAERAEPKLRGPEQRMWGERLEAEHDNLRAALEWSKAEEGDADKWLRLTGALHWFWFTRCYLSEGLERLEAALATNRSASAPARATVICGAGTLAWRQGDIKRAETLLHESLTLFRALHDNSGIGLSLHHLGHVAEQRRDFREATSCFDESLARYQDAGNTWGVGFTLECMGCSALKRGDYDRAKTLLQESLPICREVGDGLELSVVLQGLGRVAEKQGDYGRATTLLEEGLALARQFGGYHVIPDMQQALGRVVLRQGNYRRAAALHTESLVMLRRMGSKRPLAECLEGMAAVACARKRYGEGAKILGAAEAFREANGFHRAPFEQADYDHLVVSARESLRKAAFIAAWNEGRAMTLEQAIEYTLRRTDPAKSGRLTGERLREETADLLTEREQEVAALISCGMSNRQIAKQLMVTERTIETHVHNILNKLAFTSRAQVAAWAVERGVRVPTEQ